MKRAVLFLLALIFGLTVTTRASAQSLIALSTTNQLLGYDPSNVANLMSTVTISGLTGGEVMLGIDYRPANGQLYGVTNASRLYTINTTSGSASLVATLSTALNLGGTNPSIGFDFNPVADRLRIIANRSGQNLRVNPDNGVAIVDTTLQAYPGGDAFAGNFPQIAAVGYTPNVGGVTALFGYDDTTDRIVRITSPNGGTAVTVAGLGGINGSHLAGMDVGNVPNTALLSLDVGGSVFRLYSIDLTVTNPNTNSATLLGTFDTGGLSITDIADVTAVPEPSTYIIIGAAAAGLVTIVSRRKSRRTRSKTLRSSTEGGGGTVAGATR